MFLQNILTVEYWFLVKTPVPVFSLRDSPQVESDRFLSLPTLWPSPGSEVFLRTESKVPV